MKGREMSNIDHNSRVLLDAILCGYVAGPKITTKVGFLNYMAPCWVHRIRVKLLCGLSKNYKHTLTSTLRVIREKDSGDSV